MSGKCTEVLPRLEMSKHFPDTTKGSLGRCGDCRFHSGEVVGGADPGVPLSLAASGTGPRPAPLVQLEDWSRPVCACLSPQSPGNPEYLGSWDSAGQRSQH